jgi:hypothetical protein
LRLDDRPGYFIIKGNLIKFVEVNMSSIQIKSANLTTSVPRSRIRRKRKNAIIFDAYKFRYQQFISDLNGVDIKAHYNKPIKYHKINPGLAGDSFDYCSVVEDGANLILLAS